MSEVAGDPGAPPTPAAGPAVDTRGGSSGEPAVHDTPGDPGLTTAWLQPATTSPPKIGMRVPRGRQATRSMPAVASVFALTLLKPQSAGIGGECQRCSSTIIRATDPCRIPSRSAARGLRRAAPRIEWFRSQGIAANSRGTACSRRPSGHVRRVRRRAAAIRTPRPARDVGSRGGPPRRRVRDVPGTPTRAAHARGTDTRDDYPPRPARSTSTWGRCRPSAGDCRNRRGRPRSDGSSTPRWPLHARVEGRSTRCRRRGTPSIGASSPKRSPRSPRPRSYVDATGSAHSGLIEAADLAGYETRLERPASVSYRGLDIHNCGDRGPRAQSSCSNCGCWRLRPRGARPQLAGLSPYADRVGQELAFADRERWYGDPLFADVPLDRLLSTAYAARTAAPHRSGIPPRGVPAGVTRRSAAGPCRLRPRAAMGDTTHVDIADEVGQSVSRNPERRLARVIAV